MNHSHYMKAAIALLFCLPLTLQAATPVKRAATPAKKAVATATTAKKDICLQLYSVRDLFRASTRTDRLTRPTPPS